MDMQKETQTSTNAVEALQTLALQTSLLALRKAGRGAVRRRLEVLVNDEVVGVKGAQRVYRDAFGDELVAVKDRSSRRGLFGWVRQ